jgi:integrase/recombinase XerD
MRIRQRKWGRGKVGWQLDLGLVNGKRKQVSFTTEKDAQKALDRAKKAQDRLGELGRVSASDVAELMLARERLGSVRIIEAVEFYLANARIVAHPIELPDLIKRFVDYKERLGRGARFREVQLRLSAFALSVPLKHAHEIVERDVEQWVRGNRWKPKTQNNFLGELSSLFGWAVKHKHALINPCLHVERAKLPDVEIEVLTVDECGTLLKRCVQEKKHRPLLAFVALGMFCGIRPEELRRLKWDAIDLEGGTVIVAGEKAKSRRRRVVDISPNALEWLRLVPAETRAPGASIVPRSVRDRWWWLRKACGWARSRSKVGRPWPQNGLRHTFASMHYAMHQNEALLQVLMGHDSKEQLHRHYRALVTKAEAAKFWSLRPG